MRLRNEIFSFVLDWLINEKKVVDQKDLAMKTGISQNTISRIMTGKVEPKDDTLRKLNRAFGNIFNMDYLRGNSVVMLIEDLIRYKNHPEENILSNRQTEEQKAADHSPAPFIPSWADSFFDIMTQQIKQNEALNRELRQSIAEVTSLREELKNLLVNLKK